MGLMEAMMLLDFMWLQHICTKAQLYRHWYEEESDRSKDMIIDLTQRYQVVNTTTDEAIESHATEEKALQGARWCNEHEERNGRPAVYAVREQHKPQE